MEAVQKVNPGESFSGHTETYYLKLWVNKDGVIPLGSKVDAIKAIAVPTKVCDIRRFVGDINH